MLKKKIFWVLPCGTAGSQSIILQNDYFILGAIDDKAGSYQAANTIVKNSNPNKLDEFYGASDASVMAHLLTVCDFDKSLGRNGETELNSAITWDRVLVLQLSMDN